MSLADSDFAVFGAVPEPLDAFDDPAERQEPETGGIAYTADHELTEAGALELVRRIVALQSHMETIQQNAVALVKAEQARIDRLLFEHGDALEFFVRAQLTGKRRSWRCLEGVAGLRTNPARLVVADERAAVAWAAEHRPEALVTRLDPKALGKIAAGQVVDPETGEVLEVPGVTVQPETERFYVKAGTKTGGGDSEEPLSGG